jgi:hypothetical protein
VTKSSNADVKKRTEEHPYWRVTLTHSDNEISAHRVFKDREKAEKYAARQKKAPVVKKTVIEPFVRQRFSGPSSKETKG